MSAGAVLSRASERGGIGVAIVAVHALVLYALASWTPVRTLLVETTIEASLIDSPSPEPSAPPAIQPRLTQVEPPRIEPPVVSITEPAPNAITVARSSQPAPTPPPAPSAAPRMVSEVAYLQPPVPRYPKESRRTGEEGLVVLRVLIDEKGRPARIEVEQSSGFARLDNAAREAVERALFKPYMENGIPHSAFALIPIEFTWKSRTASRGTR